jgi:opacity protein-like surface antigen
MMTSTFRRIFPGIAAMLVVLAPAAAQAQITRVTGSDTRQAITIHLGAFFPTSLDSRTEGDTIFENRGSLLFDFDEFTGFSAGAEWTYGVTDYIEAGADISIYRNTVPSIYRSWFNDDGSEIAQDLKLRLIPITASVRFLPLGRQRTVQPYIGVGVTFINWRYSETGDFVDFEEGGTVFPANFVADGTEVAPVVLGGVRFLASDVFTVGGEVRWHKATGDTGGLSEGFLGDKIDLGGWTTNFSIGFRF